MLNIETQTTEENLVYSPNPRTLLRQSALMVELLPYDHELRPEVGSLSVESIDENIFTQIHNAFIQKYPDESSYTTLKLQKDLVVLRFYRELSLIEQSADLFGYDLFDENDYAGVIFNQRVDLVHASLRGYDFITPQDMELFIEESVKPLMLGWNQFQAGDSGCSEQLFDTQYHSVQGILNRRQR
jgi:hypothetical protein